MGDTEYRKQGSARCESVPCASACARARAFERKISVAKSLPRKYKPLFGSYIPSPRDQNASQATIKLAYVQRTTYSKPQTGKRTAHQRGPPATRQPASLPVLTPLLQCGIGETDGGWAPWKMWIWHRLPSPRRCWLLLPCACCLLRERQRLRGSLCTKRTHS